MYVKPFISFIGIASIPDYLFWYALGSIIFKGVLRIKVVLEGEMNIKKKAILLSGSVSLILTWLLYTYRVDFYAYYPKQFNWMLKLIVNGFVYENYRVLITILICLSMMFLSYLLSKSSLLLDLGKNTMILMGMELIVKDIVLQIFSLINIGLPTLNTDIQVIGYAFITIMVARLFFKPLNKHVPYMIGK